MEKQKDYQIHTNEADVLRSCVHVRFFDAHDFFIRNCIRHLARLIRVFLLTYTRAVLYFAQCVLKTSVLNPCPQSEHFFNCVGAGKHRCDFRTYQRALISR